ncbi:MAG: ribonuclease D, partial [Pseudohongiellaceae bacterium]
MTIKQEYPAIGDIVTDHTVVSHDSELNRLCKQWLQKDCLALDTEFMRTNTFYPKVGLIQVCDAEHNYLVDPLKIEDWDAFRQVLVDSQVSKIFHSCSEDLLVFFAFLDLIPSPVFDTQIAAAFMNKGLSLSYQNLVRELLDIDIPKGETRSDWLQRPLTDEQLEYAALDVALLPDIYRRQSRIIADRGMTDWVAEECRRAIRQYDSEVNSDFDDYYQSIKGAWQLRPRELALLKALALWRENRARKRDKPRNWIVRDQQLLAIARSFPHTRQELQDIPDISPNFVRFEAEAVLNLVLETEQLSTVEYPSPLPGPLTAAQKKYLKAAQNRIQELAASLDLPAELLGRKKTLMALLQSIQEQKTAGKANGEPATLLLPEEL